MQIARAMAFMHREGFVHSDLKPANLLVFRGREHDLIKIGDFGLAGKYLGPWGGGPAGGTMSCMAPEVLQGVPTTPSADVFSMGLIAYEMLTGENPYNRVGATLDRDRADYQAVYKQMQLDARQEPLVLRREAFPELSASAEGERLGPLLDVINKMLVPGLDPRLDQRYGSASDVLADLERLFGGGKGKPDSSALAASADPLSAALEQFEAHLSTGNWPKATEAARQVVRLRPGEAAGYLLLGRVAVRQADRVAHGGGVKGAARFRRQALAELQRGLDVCHGPACRQRLRQEMANVHQSLGDDRAAEGFRRPDRGA